MGIVENVETHYTRCLISKLPSCICSSWKHKLPTWEQEIIGESRAEMQQPAEAAMAAATEKIEIDGNWWIRSEVWINWFN